MPDSAPPEISKTLTFTRKQQRSLLGNGLLLQPGPQRAQSNPDSARRLFPIKRFGNCSAMGHRDSDADFLPPNLFLMYKSAPKTCIPGPETVVGGNDEPPPSVSHPGICLGADYSYVSLLPKRAHRNLLYPFAPAKCR